jgi:tripartite-type tricarboxylate transporter receptor subunit TctC
VLSRDSFGWQAFGRLALAAALLFGGLSQAAAEYPDRPIRLVVPYPPGATNDLLARVLAEPLAKELGQPVIVDNKGGAATAIGAAAVASAPADGYTLLLGTGTTYTLNGLLKKGLAYDTDRDFKLVSILAEVPCVFIVNPQFPAQTLGDFVAYAKAHPGAVNYSSSGLGSSLHLAGELFAQRAGIKLTHVPYPGSAGAMRALLANEVQMMSEVLSGALPQMQQKAVMALAVTSAKRTALAPDVPTVAESGFPGFEAVGWYALAIPKATPPAIAHRIEAAINKILGEGALKARFEPLGIEIPGPQEPGWADKYMITDRALWEPLIRKLNLSLD